jgi:membrane protein implicated in regulation of membrane protease activity
MNWSGVFAGLKGTRLHLAIGFVVLLMVLVGCDFLVSHHPAFGIDGTPGFAAWYGIVAAVAAIALATLWADIARRPETRAEEEERDG